MRCVRILNWYKGAAKPEPSNTTDKKKKVIHSSTVHTTSSLPSLSSIIDLSSEL